MFARQGPGLSEAKAKCVSSWESPSVWACLLEREQPGQQYQYASFVLHGCPVRPPPPPPAVPLTIVRHRKLIFWQTEVSERLTPSEFHIFHFILPPFSAHKFHPASQHPNIPARCQTKCGAYEKVPSSELRRSWRRHSAKRNQSQLRLMPAFGPFWSALDPLALTFNCLGQDEDRWSKQGEEETKKGPKDMDIKNKHNSRWIQ